MDTKPDLETLEDLETETTEAEVPEENKNKRK